MKVQDVLGCAGSAIILLWVSAWVPFAISLSPLPFLYYTAKLGLYRGVTTTVITVLAASVIANMAGKPQIIYPAIKFSLLGLLISETYRREYSFGFTILCGTTLMILFQILDGIASDMGPLELVSSYFQNPLTEMIQTYEEMGWDQEKIKQLQELSKIMTSFVSKIYPALLVLEAGFVVWLTVVISRPLFRLTKLKYPNFDPIDRWRAPEHMVWGLIAAGFAWFLPVESLDFLARNALIVMLVVYMFHGLSIVLFFLNKYNVPSWIRLGMYLLILMSLLFLPIFMVGLAFAGVFDQWIDFRKIHIKKA